MRGGSGVSRVNANGAALLLWCSLPALVINLVAILQPWVRPVELYRDPLLAAEHKFLYMAGLPGGLNGAPYDFFWLGAVSNLGALLWAATAGMVFTALVFVMLRSGTTTARRAQLLTALVLTVLLAVDDVFQIHEQRHLVGSLKGEWILFPLFAVLAASYALHARRVGTPANALLLAAVLCFAVSLGADQVLPQRGVTVLIEDASKLSGICFWAGYHLVMALCAIVEALAEPVRLASARGGAAP